MHRVALRYKMYLEQKDGPRHMTVQTYGHVRVVTRALFVFDIMKIDFYMIVVFIYLIMKGIRNIKQCLCNGSSLYIAFIKTVSILII